MLPLTKNDSHPSTNNMILFLPEILLLLGLLIFNFLPFSVLGYMPLIAEPIISTVVFIVAFAVLQIITFTFVWRWCKSSSGDEAHEHEKYKESYSYLQALLLVGLCWVTLHAGCVLFGAPVFNQITETATWSLLVATLITIPSSCLLGTNVQVLFKVLVCGKFKNATERFLYLQSAGAILGSWASAIVIPLDWDRPWQAWPIPGVMGALFGYATAIILSCSMIRREMKTEKVT